MVVTIQQVLCPFLITSFIMGLSAYPTEQPKPRIRLITYLSILYCLTIWMSYAYLFEYALTFYKYKSSFEYMYEIVLTINIFSVITSVIVNFYHQKKFEMCLKKLSIVDDTLEELGVPKTYQKIHTCSKLVVIGWIVYSLIKNFTDASWFPTLKEIYSWRLFLNLVINHSVHINTFLDFLFIFLLWYVGTRFDKVNERMRYLLVTNDYGLKCTWKKSVVALHRYIFCTDYKQTLWTSMHLHSELCRIVRELNFKFGTQIIFGMAINLISITSICYGLSTTWNLPKEKLQTLIKHKQNISLLFAVSFNCFVLLMRIYAVNYICESVMDKASKIDKIIHQLSNTLRYADVCQEVYQFTLQVMHRPLKLTGMNLFYLGNECLRKFCIMIVTYMIIMVQLKITVSDENYV